MSIDINEIMDMLDWNNETKIQEEGRKLAEGVKCLKIFIQPGDKQYCKNVWENCALILSKKTDELLQPYIYELLDWLQDLNWPGADIILERLQHFQNYESLAWALQEKVRLAQWNEDDIWIMNMAQLLIQEQLFNYLSDDAREVLKKSIEL